MISLINVSAGACIKIFPAFFIYKFEITHCIFINICIYIRALIKLTQDLYVRLNMSFQV